MADEALDQSGADENTFYFEEVEVDDDDDGEYKEVSDIDSEIDEDDENENFDELFATLNQADIADPAATQPLSPVQKTKKAVTIQKPVVVDDFIRNFMIKTGMKKSLDAFQAEWYEMKESGRIQSENTVVPDLYVKNEQLDNQLYALREEAARAQAVAEKARGTWEKFRRERDFHRMHHRRVQQEKATLLRDMKRLQAHCAQFEPALKQAKHKYETVLKDLMLVQLEKERMQAKLEALESQVKQLESMNARGSGADLTETTVNRSLNVSKSRSKKRGDSAKKRGKSGKSGAKRSTPREKKSRESVIPPEDRINPHLSRNYVPAQGQKYTLRKTFKGHQAPVSCVAVHPKKMLMATGSDDCTWKLWSLPKGELIMSGVGHDDWLGSCKFNPRGTHLSTASGDGTVKLWSLAEARCMHTFTDHAQSVWSADWHWTGDFIVSGSMDQTVRLLDVATGKCRQTFRGHVDSVNLVEFLPFANTICSASADKTISLWDMRTGLCVQVLDGHNNAVLHAAFNLQGDSLVSSDADGVVKLWDVRMVAQRLEILTCADSQRHPVNCSSFDASGQVVASGTNDAMLKFHSAADGSLLGALEGHQSSVQALAWDPGNRYLVTGASDSAFRLWN